MEIDPRGIIVIGTSTVYDNDEGVNTGHSVTSSHCHPVAAILQRAFVDIVGKATSRKPQSDPRRRWRS